MDIKYIVTGTGRCGTMFMSKFLTSAGINCGHELIFTNDGISAARQNIKSYNNFEADSSYMAAPYLQSDLLSNSRIIHIVREPMMVINSFVVSYCYFLSHTFDYDGPVDNFHKWTYEYAPGADPEFKFMKFMYSHVRSLYKKNITPLERAAIYYVAWNKMIEKSCVGRRFLFHPIESDVSKITDFIDVENLNLYNNKETNKSTYNNVIYGFRDIKSSPIKNDIIEMSRRYGYYNIKLY